MKFWSKSAFSGCVCIRGRISSSVSVVVAILIAKLSKRRSLSPRAGLNRVLYTRDIDNVDSENSVVLYSALYSAL